MTVTHSTFTIDRDYPVPPARAFAAWADPKQKAVWFTGSGADHEMDFKVGGKETARGGELRFEATYREIVPERRIVTTSTMHDGERLSTVSVTTVEFAANGAGTKIVVTEHGAYLDDQEKPEWREQGTNDQLTALAKLLENS